MCLRIAILLFALLGGWAAEASAQSTDPAPTADASPNGSIRSSVQGVGVGEVLLKPDVLRLSIPIKIQAEAAWDATEELRNVRRAIVERVSEMGAIENSLKVFGFQCGEELPSSYISPRGETPKPKYAAQCFVVADFPLREGRDDEETLGLSQAQLAQLTSLLPKAEASRRSYSVSTSVSGFTSQQLENPLAVYVAKVSAEEKAKAFRQAFDSGNAQVRATLEALGVKAANLSVSHSPNYTSLRAMHPLEASLGGNQVDEAVGLHVDGVPYSVRLMVVAHFEQLP